MSEPGGGPDLSMLRERLSLGLATARRPRAIAVLFVHAHAPPGGPALPRGLVPHLHHEIERRVRACLSGSDSVASVGDLRLTVLLERAEEGPFAMHAADRIVQAIGAISSLGATPVRLVASVGISAPPDDGDAVEELLRCAEAAAEAAELGGGDLFGFYSQPMNMRARRRAQIERALEGALDRHELYLVYQPQIDTRDGTLVGVEALLRFESATLGPITPDELVPVLEATGKIEHIGAWVLEQAAAQAAAWHTEGKPVRVGVNVSARQLMAPGFDATVARAVDRAGVPSGLVELELTESVLVENPIEARARIEAIRSRGVRVALDDFGTGYASLSYVRQLAVDGLKIDRQFVRGLPVDAEAVAITSAIAALAHCLRLDVVAEGVESEAEEEFLHTQRCFIVQGFLHARPMRGPAFEAWRSARPWA